MSTLKVDWSSSLAHVFTVLIVGSIKVSTDLNLLIVSAMGQIMCKAELKCRTDLHNFTHCTLHNTVSVSVSVYFSKYIRKYTDIQCCKIITVNGGMIK